MDSELLIIILWFVASLLMGQMDKIRFHWSRSIFSTVKNKRLWNWFNPSYRPTFKKAWVSFIFNHSFLIGFIDFWHLLKGIIIQIIIFTFVCVVDCGVGLYILLNAIYWVAFEFSFASLNKKT